MHKEQRQMYLHTFEFIAYRYKKIYRKNVFGGLYPKQ